MEAGLNVEELDRPRLGEARRELIRTMLMDAGAVTVSELQVRFGISPITARRDLDELERRGSARRTHGGAVLPSVLAPEHSFAQRMGVATRAKERLAEAALELVCERETVFLDSSTTAYFVARGLARDGKAVRVITNSGPIMQVIAACEHPQIELVAIGGTLRRFTGSFVGPASVRAVREHFADRLFMSVTGITPSGVMTDGDVLEAEVKRAMLEQAGETTVLVDGAKLAVQGRQAIGPITAATRVLADGPSAADCARLRAAGAAVQVVG
jgi:DeoR/GlpR family transcriptional regulator of sugar metabolism